MKNKLKVLMVVFNLSIANGVSSYVMNYYRSLNHGKISMDFALYQDVDSPYYDEIRQHGDDIFLIPPIKNISRHMQESRKIIEQGKYDIIHDNILILSYFLMYYAKKMGVPVRILHSHNGKLGETKYKEVRNALTMPMLRNLATDYFACSTLAARSMFGNRKFTFIPNVVNADIFQFASKTRNAVRKQMQVDKQQVIVSVGRLSYQKNPFYAIDVICELYKQRNDICYWWIGNGPLEDKVREYIHQKDAEGFIKLLGRQNNVIDFYQAADLFFLPSCFEGLPVTGVEAQAMGLPCVVSDTITKEFVFTDLVRFFSLQSNPRQIAGLINEILNQNNPRSDKRELLLSSCFADQNSGAFLFNLYKEILKERSN